MKKTKKLKQGRGFYLFRTPVISLVKDSPQKLWILLFLIISLLIFTPLLWLSSSPPESKEPRAYIQQNQAKITTQESVSISGAMGCKDKLHTCDTSRDADHKKLQRDQDFIKEKRDLNAQEGVWRASNVVANYASIQTLLTAIGVALLMLTLKATQETVKFSRDALTITQESLKEAQKAAKTAKRTLKLSKLAQEIEFQPYFKITIDEFKFTEHGHSARDKVGIGFRLGVTNLGKTPAFDILIEFGETDTPILSAYATGDDGWPTASFTPLKIFKEPCVDLSEGDKTVTDFIRETCVSSDKNFTDRTGLIWHPLLLTINCFTVRYKDFSCPDGCHKMAVSEKILFEDETGTFKRDYGGSCRSIRGLYSDSEHDYYKNTED